MTKDRQTTESFDVVEWSRSLKAESTMREPGQLDRARLEAFVRRIGAHIVSPAVAEGQTRSSE